MKDTENHERRDQFLKDFNAEKKKRNKKIIAITSIITMLGIALFVYFNNKTYVSKTGGNYNIGQSINYEGVKVEMTDIDEPIVEDGKVKVPIKEIEENKILYMEYRGGDPDHVYYGRLEGGVLPLMAFVSRAGRIVFATSVCEPCYGTKFYLENDALVCVACGTRWRTTDLQGMGGGCYNYPPEELKYEVEGEYIVVPESEIRDWEPRHFEDDVMG